jgi:selenium metabolism protein YedF
MQEIVDARGLGCPQPVILAKQALERHRRIVVLVNDPIAAENVRRLGVKMGCEITMDRKDDGDLHIHLSHSGTAQADASIEVAPEADRMSCAPGHNETLVVVISENSMGRGNEELGYILIKAFLHTLLQLDRLPDRMIFYNTGVKLVVTGSDVLDDLHQLQNAGVDILVCGTCVNYFGLSDSIAAGRISNMFEIANAMTEAGKLIAP